MEELKPTLLPCPFCGRNAYISETVNGTNLLVCGCSNCGIELKAAWVPDGGHPTRCCWSKDIIKLWNTRATTSIDYDEFEQRSR